MAGLHDILAHLKKSQPATSEASNSAPSATLMSDQLHGYLPPVLPSEIFSLSPGGPQPHHQSASMSANTSATNTPAPDPSSSDRTASLLNLLRFNQPKQNSTGSGDPQSSQSIFQAQGSPAAQPSPITASNLVAQLTRKSPSSLPQTSSMILPATVSPLPRRDVNPSSSENAQDFLLKLLNTKPKSTEMGSSQPTESQSAQEQAEEREEASVRVFGSRDAGQVTQFEAPQVAQKGSIFTYVNPFEHLSASSPRNRTPKPEAKPGIPTGSTAPPVEILKPQRDLLTKSHDTGKPPNSYFDLASSQPPSTSAPAVKSPDGNAAATSPRESVAQALSEVAEQVERQVDQALYVASKDNGSGNVNAIVTAHTETKKESTDDGQEDIVKSRQRHDPTAAHISSSKTSRNPLPEASRQATKGDEEENVADSWESAEDQEEAGKNSVSPSSLHTFPMKPFVSIEINQLQGPTPSVRQDSVMEIARLKKDFDQIDRNLIAATQNFIVYGLAKHGGFRLIRQDSGKYKHLFQSSKERIFNLALCSDPSALVGSQLETVIGTGTNGSVFWVELPKSAGESDGEEIEKRGFIFPPVPQEDNSSGGQLKTRVKKSSRHPEFFGIGRGKSIYIIRSQIVRQFYTDSKSGVVDVDRYLDDWNLKIATGKAGKDFAFSEDDTVVVSLDKAGKLKFWDVRELTHGGGQTSTRIDPVEVRSPLLSLVTSPSSDKVWPTSVFFLDKERPSTKGIALRYLIVGMKQNHSLQLWDLGLGKPVQEINFPHNKESDPICSIAYHPKTGVLVVGHPTRNSIYLIHLSAPRYNIPSMNQARYIQRLAQKDPNLPKPESTAIMSGVREISFAPKGDLRSLDILSTPVSSGDSFSQDTSTLFELYVMHSKGVTCLRMVREDLGWSKDGKILHPINAETVGAVTVKSLRAIPTPASSEPSLNGDASSQPQASKLTPKEVVKRESSARSPQPQSAEASMIASTLARVENKQDAARAAIINGSDKGSTKKKKRIEPMSQATDVFGATLPLAAPTSYAQAAQGAQFSPRKSALTSATPGFAAQNAEPIASEGERTGAQAPAVAEGNTGLLEGDLKRMEEGLTTEISKAFQEELGSLYKKIDDDKRVQDAAGAAKQDAVLRLVSSTLTENVEKSLSRIVSSTMKTTVLPSLIDTTTTTIIGKVTDLFNSGIPAHIQSELKAIVPGAVNRAVQEPDFIRLVSDLVSSKVAGQIDTHLTKAFRTTIMPSFTESAVRAAQQAAGDIERRTTEQIRHTEVQRVNDSSKIDQLTNLVRGLSETVHTMAAAQTEFQNEILKLQRQLSSQASDPPTRSEGPVKVAPIQKSSEDQELDLIAKLIGDGNYQDGTVRWLQSPNQGELFERFFCRVDPFYITRLSQLLMLSVAAAVTSTMASHVPERLSWLETIFPHLDAQNDEVVGVFRQIMDVLLHRLQTSYMEIADTGIANPVLKRISGIVKRATELRATAP